MQPAHSLRITQQRRIILEELMLDMMYTIPSERDIKECVITKDIVLNRNQPRPLKKAV